MTPRAPVASSRSGQPLPLGLPLPRTAPVRPAVSPETAPLCGAAPRSILPVPTNCPVALLRVPVMKLVAD